MKIEHVAMYVNDLEAAKDFFLRYFGGYAGEGYHNKSTGFRSFFIYFDNGARLELMTKPGLLDLAKPLNRTGFCARRLFCRGQRDRRRSDGSTQGRRL